MSIKWYSLKQEDPDLNAERSRKDLFERFVSLNNIVRWYTTFSDGEEVAYYLHKKAGHMRKTGAYKNLFGTNHRRIYQTAQKDRVFVCHIYSSFYTKENIDKINTWADENGLVVEFYDPSMDWYYHSGAYLAIVHLPHVKICI